MWTPSIRVTGGVTGLGAILAALAAVPTGWFGPRPTDSYVFDPPQFSALWIERTVIPVVAIAAAILLLAGLLSLLWRDREWMDRWQRWFAVIAVVGAAIVTLGTMLVFSAEETGTSDLNATINVLVGVVLGLLGATLSFSGLVAWGVGYIRNGRQRLGAALVAGPVVSSLFVVVSLAAGLSLDPFGGLVIILPLVLAALTVGSDLWGRP